MGHLPHAPRIDAPTLRSRDSAREAAFATATSINQGELSLPLKTSRSGRSARPPQKPLQVWGQPPLWRRAGRGPRNTCPGRQLSLHRTDRCKGRHGSGKSGQRAFSGVIEVMNFVPAYIRSVVGFMPPGRLTLVPGVSDSMSKKILLINALWAQPDGTGARSADQVLYPPVLVTDKAIIRGCLHLIQRLDQRSRVSRRLPSEGSNTR